MPVRDLWGRGQIILVMCMTLVVVIISIATIIYLTSTHHLFFNYNPSREVILSIDSDFERALIRILANATAQYNRTRSEDVDIDEMKESRRIANMTFSYWFMATQAAYAGKGVNIEADWIDDVIQGEKDMPMVIGWIRNQGQSGRKTIVQHYPARTLENKLVKLFWYRPNSISAIGSKIKIDSAIGGIVGWESKHIVFLNLTITSIWSDEKREISYINVVVLREENKPVNDLKKESFELYWFDPTTPQGRFWWRRAEGNEITVTYNGGGNYTLILKPDFWDKSPQARGKRETFWKWGNDPGYYQFVIVRVKDSRDIIVEAYSYSGIEYLIQENAVEPYYPNVEHKTKETYVFELLPNGTLYWFETALPVRTVKPIPPIPIPPVKQLRVYATLNYDDLNGKAFREVPYQVEIWNSDYTWPNRTNFLGWRKRFMGGAKLVFEVNYPPGCRRQAVRVMWLDDCDAEVPDPNIEVRVTGGLARVDTGINNPRGYGYILWIVVDKEEFSKYFEHVDWSMSLRDRYNNSHVEYMITAYDSYRIGNTYYIPIKFPEDKWSIVPAPDNKTGIAKAPVRIVAFRKSDRVVYTSPHPQVGLELRDEIEYEDMVYIPYNTTYFLYSVKAKWKKDVVIQYSYLVFAGIIGGYPDNAYASQTINRFKWGSLLASNGKIVNGTFNNRNVYTPHRGRALGSSYGYGNYSFWAALYNESWGAAIFASKQLIDMLDTYGREYRGTDQLFVWTRGLGASRFMEYDAIALESATSTTIRVRDTPTVEFKFAGFMIGGGIADDSSKYDNDWEWDDGRGTYARPFRIVMDPQKPVITEIRRVERNAFAYDDFSNDPSYCWSFSTGGWTWDSQNRLLKGTAPDGSFTLATYTRREIPSGKNNLYILAKIRFTTTTNGQHVGLVTSASSSSFYMLDFYRDSSGNNNDFKRLGIWKYSGSWDRLRRTNTQLSLSYNTWYLFYGSRTLRGAGAGSMTISIYDSSGNQQLATLSTASPDTSIAVSRVGLGLRDENSGSGTISADFDFFVACTDADPGRVRINGLQSGMWAIIKDSNGNEVARAQAVSGVATLNVISRPVIRNGVIEIRDSRGNVIFTKNFSDDIVGGDVYECLTSGSTLNAVEECNMYYRMFTCRTLENGNVDDMPTIVDIYPAY